MRTRGTIRRKSTSTAIAFAALFVACGGPQYVPMTTSAPPPAQVPAAPSRQQLTDLDALQYDLELSERRLFAELDRQRAFASSQPVPDSKTKAAEEPPPLPPAPPPAEPARPGKAQSPRKPTMAGPPPPETRERDPDADEAPAPRAAMGSPCDLACRALASMRRAADGICAITGPSDGRCVAAQERVKVSTAEVERARCVCGAAP
jgi:hypothetical protein